MKTQLAALAFLCVISTSSEAVMNDVDTRGHYNDAHDQRICRRLTHRPAAYDLCKLPPLSVISPAG